MNPTVSSFNVTPSGTGSFERMSTSPKPEEPLPRVYMSDELPQFDSTTVQHGSVQHPSFIMLLHGPQIQQHGMASQGPTAPYTAPPSSNHGIQYVYGSHPTESRSYEIPIPMGSNPLLSTSTARVGPSQWVPEIVPQLINVPSYTAQPPQSPPHGLLQQTSKQGTEKQRRKQRKRHTSRDNSDSESESSEEEYDSDEESESEEESERESDHSPKRQRSSSPFERHPGESTASDQANSAVPIHAYLAQTQGFQPVKSTMISQRLGMPLPKTRGAPPTFKGHYGDVENFLMHFEELCQIHGITDGPTRCRMIVRYCSTNVRNTVEGISGFAKGNWQKVRSEMLKLWDAEFRQERYGLDDLEKYVDKKRRLKMKSLEQWRKYTRGNLSKDEYQQSFWEGIHSHFAQRLEDKLELMYPDWDRKRPWTYDQTTKAAELLLKRGTYAQRRQRLQKDNDSESDPESDDESGSSSSEEEETRTRSRSGKSKASKVKPAIERRSKSVSPKAKVAVVLAPEATSIATPAMTPENRLAKINSEEHRLLEETVSRMSSLSRTDPRYAMAYMRVIALEPASQEWLAKPLPPQESVHPGQNVAQTFGVHSPSANQSPQNLARPYSTGNGYKDMPPHLAPMYSYSPPQGQYVPQNQYPASQAPAQNMNVPPQGFRNNAEKTCYGCG
ncbi:hypothetical protein K488DRAFT_75222 [Vararia minispora EC-137]|uniref:Uncharacterized protein n=1 Tax=Vararia minispora EC-137 TaxID=1314806 RepID=A0ACB8Q4K7_9AGAM|nr:hypothetical protein K488DRAFT_75222 [Vararia minispora EC-137]